MPVVDADEVIGSWVHAHEEDDGERIVMRRPDHPFPPSRGRVAITLEPGGRLGTRHPGPDDRSVAGEGSWSLSGTELAIAGPAMPGEYEIESVDHHALVLRPLRKAE